MGAGMFAAPCISSDLRESFPLEGRDSYDIRSFADSRIITVASCALVALADGESVESVVPTMTPEPHAH